MRKYLSIIYSIIWAVAFGGLSIYIGIFGESLLFPILLLFASFIHAKGAEKKIIELKSKTESESKTDV